MATISETYTLVTMVMRRLRRAYDTRAAERGLTMSRVAVLLRLSQQEGSTQADLASILGIEAPTAKRQIDALEKQGLIRREAIDGDVRKRALFLTDKAREISVTKFAANVRQEIFAGLSPEELDQLHLIFEKIERNVSRICDDE